VQEIGGLFRRRTSFYMKGEVSAEDRKKRKEGEKSGYQS